MKRTITTALVAVALVVGLAGPASAVANPDYPTPTAPHPRRPPSISEQIPLCVTTTWRAKHTHKPKTKRGAVCVATPDMWIPRRWVYLFSADPDLTVWVAR